MTWSNAVESNHPFTKKDLDRMLRLVKENDTRRVKEMMLRDTQAWDFLKRVKKAAPELMMPLVASRAINGEFIVSPGVGRKLKEKGLI